jgi:hypothetical protein
MWGGGAPSGGVVEAKYDVKHGLLGGIFMASTVPDITEVSLFVSYRVSICVSINLSSVYLYTNV